MRLSPRSCLFAFLMLCAASLALAQEIDLYEGETPVQGQEAGERESALVQALGQVLVKLSGQRGAASDPRLQEGLARAPALARQFRYRQDLDTSSGVPEYRQYLVARFDPGAVEVMLADAGLPLWPAPRPRLALWLVIDDGRGPRLVAAAQGGAVGALTRRARERGLRVELPGDGGDDAALGLRAAWHEDAEALAALAGRHRGNPVLLGTLRRSGDGWAAEWVLREGEQVLQRWIDARTDARELLAEGADASVDVLARRYADLLASGPAGTYAIEVSGLRSSEDFLRLMGYLETLAIVRASTPRGAKDERLWLDLDLSTGLAGFDRLIASGRVLEAAPAEGDTPAYRLRH